MPRHVKRDKETTNDAYLDGVLRDPKRRSFLATDGRLFLYGVDMSDQRGRVLKRDDKCCTVCGKFVGNKGEVDHFPIARGRGGDDSMDNLRTSCKQCHGETHGGKGDGKQKEHRTT